MANPTVIVNIEEIHVGEKFMECIKCHTQVMYCPCCGEKLVVTTSPIELKVEKPIAALHSQPIQPEIFSLTPQEIALNIHKNATEDTIEAETARLILLSGNTNEPESFYLDNEVNLVGRPDLTKNSFPQIDLSFDKQGTISRYHAYIHKRDGRFFLEDLGSGNGTFLFDGNNLEKLTPRQLYPLQNKNRIRFGKVLMQFIIE